MAAPEVELVRGKTSWGAAAEEVEQLADGWRGTRDYTVFTSEPAAAILAAGVPQTGDAWDASFPNLLAVSRRCRFVAGTDDPLTQTGGKSWVRVSYETPGLRGRLPVPTALTKYCRLLPGSTTLQRVYDVRAVENAFTQYAEPILAGRGAPITVGTMQVVVTTFPTPQQLRDLVPKMIDLARVCKLNEETIRFPPLLGEPYEMQLEPGQAKYLTFALDREQGLLALQQTIEIAPNFDFVWQVEDDTGQAIASVTSQVYERGDFSGLW